MPPLGLHHINCSAYPLQIPYHLGVTQEIYYCSSLITPKYPRLRLGVTQGIYHCPSCPQIPSALPRGDLWYLSCPQDPLIIKKSKSLPTLIIIKNKSLPTLIIIKNKSLPPLINFYLLFLNLLIIIFFKNPMIKMIFPI